MKLTFTLNVLAALLAAGAARANYAFTVTTDIPQGNPVGLISDGRVSGLPNGGIIASLSLNLNLSGGYNGDLYGYLEAPSGATAILFNQPGVTDSDPFGYGGSGFNVTLSDAGASTLQNTPETDGIVFAGTYQPVTAFSTLSGGTGNGEWTLFLADVANGGGQPVLDQWSLDIETSAAPEPGQVGAMVLLMLAGAVWGIARHPATRKGALSAICQGLVMARQLRVESPRGE